MCLLLCSPYTHHTTRPTVRSEWMAIFATECSEARITMVSPTASTTDKIAASYHAFKRDHASFHCVMENVEADDSTRIMSVVDAAIASVVA